MKVVREKVSNEMAEQIRAIYFVENCLRQQLGG